MLPVQDWYGNSTTSTQLFHSPLASYPQLRYPAHRPLGPLAIVVAPQAGFGAMGVPTFFSPSAARVFNKGSCAAG